MTSAEQAGMDDQILANVDMHGLTTKARAGQDFTTIRLPLETLLGKIGRVGTSETANAKKCHKSLSTSQMRVSCR